MINLLLIAGGFAILFVTGELLYRFVGVSAEITRKLVHTVAGVLAATLPWFLTFSEVMILGVGFVVILALSQYFNLLPSIHRVGRTTLGELAFPFGLLFGALFFFRSHPTAFQFGAVVLALADSGAAVIGQGIGKHTYSVFGSKKSYEGSMAFFIIAMITSLFFGYYTGLAPVSLIAIPVLASAVLTIIEGVTGRGLDNLILPSAAGILGVWLQLL